jgi:hypothetical protein
MRVPLKQQPGKIKLGWNANCHENVKRLPEEEWGELAEADGE